MAPAVLFRGGPSLRLVKADGTSSSFRLTDLERDAAWLAGVPSTPVPDPVVRWLATASGGSPVLVEDAALVRAAQAAGLSAELAGWFELRRLRETVGRSGPAEVRALLLEVAALALQRALEDPEQTLISLVREEERLERALGRESSAVDQLLVPATSGVGADYLREAHGYRAALARHHDGLRSQLEALSREIAPTLTSLVGSPLAGRLIAAAGGTRPLARMSGARIQLLGTRRRPSPVRGPRYGHLYRAPLMDQVPRSRSAAYARSLAALAAIAIRADVHTRRDLSTELLARRDRRVRQLQRAR